MDCITLVIPTLNEAEAIGAVIDEAKRAGFQKIVVVDGGSTDGTPQIAREKGAVVIGQTGRGKGDAVKTALDYVDTPYVAFIDGDYSYPPGELARIAGYLRKYDLVLGARQGPMPALYRAGNWILARVISLLYGVKLRDPLTGMYAAKTELLRRAAVGADGFDLEAEIIAKAVERGASIREVPVAFRQRLGKKKLKPWHGLSILWRAVKAAYLINPLVALYAAGALLAIPGVALGGWVAYEMFYVGVPHYMLGLLALGLFLLGAVSLALIPLAANIVRIRATRIELVGGEADGCLPPMPPPPAPQPRRRPGIWQRIEETARGLVIATAAMLAAAAYFLAVGDTATANRLAQYAYYSLAGGTLLYLALAAREKNQEEAHEAGR